jgi:hypothetical protein
MNIEFYKIYNPILDKYAKGNSDIDDSHWTLKGKCWNEIGHVKNHLREMLYGYTKHGKHFGNKTEWVYKNCQVVKITNDDISTESVNMVLSRMMSKHENINMYDYLVREYGIDKVGDI